MQSKQIKIQDFEKKVRQFLYDFFSGTLLPETGKGFFNGFPGRVDMTFVRVKVAVSTVDGRMLCHAER